MKFLSENNNQSRNTKKIIIKKSLNVLILETICKLSTAFASANPAKNPPISIDNPIASELTSKATPNAQAKLNEKSNSSECEIE